MLFNKLYYIFLTAERDPFRILSGNGISRNSQLRVNAASAYNLFFIIGIIGLVVTLILSGVRLSFSKSSSKKSEIKENLGRKTIVAIIFFGFITLISIVYKVIKELT